MHEFVTTATIRASREAVWKILTDAAGYADWNPEIVALEGHLGAGERIRARVKVGSGKIRPVPLRVTAFDPPTCMEWTGGLPLGLFTGLRILTVTPANGGVEFRIVVQMSGPLASMMVKAVGDRQAEIDGFSAALKARAESTTKDAEPARVVLRSVDRALVRQAESMLDQEGIRHLVSGGPLQDPWSGDYVGGEYELCVRDDDEARARKLLDGLNHE